MGKVYTVYFICPGPLQGGGSEAGTDIIGCSGELAS